MDPDPIQIRHTLRNIGSYGTRTSLHNIIYANLQWYNQYRTIKKLSITNY
jgi:hypothetical protein